MANPVDTSGNVKVDFVWGNFAMQPNDGRNGDGADVVVAADADQNYDWKGYSVFLSEELDPVLDNHSIVYNEWNGFPSYTPVDPFLDNTANTVVPDVIGETESDAQTALEDADLVKGTVTTSTVGATVENDETVKSQSPTAGTTVNKESSVDLVLFEAATVPNVVGKTEAEATASLTAAGLVKGDVTTSTEEAGVLNDGTVKSQDPAAGDKADTGSAVDLVLYLFEG
jgi:hypothetical protein